MGPILGRNRKIPMNFCYVMKKRAEKIQAPKAGKKKGPKKGPPKRKTKKGTPN